MDHGVHGGYSMARSLLEEGWSLTGPPGCIRCGPRTGRYWRTDPPLLHVSIYARSLLRGFLGNRV